MDKTEQEAAEAFELLMEVLAYGGVNGHPLGQRIFDHCMKYSTRPTKSVPALEVKDKDGAVLFAVK